MVLRVRVPEDDLPPLALKQFLKPPSSPDERHLRAYNGNSSSADLKTKITPCQFGGEPDALSADVVASMGLAAIGDVKLGGFISIGPESFLRVE